MALTDPVTVNDHGLSRRDAARGGAAERWTALNAQALLRFWFEGHAWGRKQVDAFIEGLQKVA